MRFLPALLIVLLQVTAIAQTPWLVDINPIDPFDPNAHVPKFATVSVELSDLGDIGGEINSDDATAFTGNTVSLNAPLTLHHSLSIHGFSLAVADGVTLTVGNGGYLGVTAAEIIPLASGYISGSITVESGGTLALEATTTLNHTTVITNRGTVLLYAHHGQFLGQDTYLTTGNAHIVNEAGGVVEILATGGSLGDRPEQTLELVNNGTVRLASTISEFRFDTYLKLSGSGIYDIPEGTTLNLSNGSADGFRATGLGRVNLADNTTYSGTLSGNLYLPNTGGTVTMNNAVVEGVLTLSSGTLAGDMTVTGC